MPTLASRVFRALACLVTCVAVGGGCAAQNANPSFNVSMDDAQHLLREMRANPKPLDRPLVILGGFFDPGIGSMILCDQFRQLSGDDRVIGVSFLFCGDFDACRRQVIEAVDKAFPSGNPEWTSEVDVIGMSMGGLVARYAAAEPTSPAGGRRLRVARMFTISTPHRGAALAGLPTFNHLQLDMRADSPFLRRLTAAEAHADCGNNYTLYPYVRLGDVTVGAENAAPDGRTPWWVPAEPFQDSHLMAMVDARIIADISRRLRGEPPLAADPPQPLPTNEPPATESPTTESPATEPIQPAPT